MQTGISLNGADRGAAIKDAAEAIVTILEAPAEEKTVRCALETLAHILGDGTVTIRDTIIGDRTIPDALANEFTATLALIREQMQAKDAPTPQDAEFTP